MGWTARSTPSWGCLPVIVAVVVAVDDAPARAGTLRCNGGQRGGDGGGTGGRVRGAGRGGGLRREYVSHGGGRQWRSSTREIVRRRGV